jgi:cation diffusion facilitator family transporter
MNDNQSLKTGEKVTMQAGVLMLALTLVKVIVGFVSNSVILLSDSLHSASDLVPIILSWLGLKISQKKPTQQFAYGFYKAENLATLSVSIIIMAAAGKIFLEGHNKLFVISQLNMPLLALAISATDAVVLYFFGKYEENIGKKIGSRSLQALGEENKAHLFTSMAVFVGIALTYFKTPFAEGLLTIGISILIFKIGLFSFKDAVLGLLDVSPSIKIQNRIAKTIKSITGIEELIDLKLRKSGPFILGQATIGIRRSLDVEKAQQIKLRIEKEVKSQVDKLEGLVVDIKPFKSNYCHLAIPVLEENGLSSKIAQKFGRAPYFLFLNLENKKIKSHYVIKNLFIEDKIHAGLKTAKLIADQKIDILICLQIGEIAFYTLRDNLVDIYKAKAKTAKQAVLDFNNNKLKSILIPKKIND